MGSVNANGIHRIVGTNRSQRMVTFTGDGPALTRFAFFEEVGDISSHGRPLFAGLDKVEHSFLDTKVAFEMRLFNTFRSLFLRNRGDGGFRTDRDMSLFLKMACW